MTGAWIPESFAVDPDHAARLPGKTSLPPTTPQDRGEQSWTVVCPCTSSTGTPLDSAPARKAANCAGAAAEIPGTAPASALRDACSRCRGPAPADHACREAVPAGT